MNKDYFQKLTPRQQLNDLMHKYAQENDLDYGESWRELDERWKEKYGDSLSWLRLRHGYNPITIPGYLEAVNKLDDALIIGHEMTGNEYG